MSSINEARRDVRCVLPKPAFAQMRFGGQAAQNDRKSAAKRREYTTGDPGGIAPEK
jgi:hypothetical protein